MLFRNPGFPQLRFKLVLLLGKQCYKSEFFSDVKSLKIINLQNLICVILCLTAFTIITISISFLLFTPLGHDIFALIEKTEMKNGNRSTKRNNKKYGSLEEVPLFDHDYIISRLFDSIFEMDTGRTILTKKIKTSKTNNINSKTKKGKK